MIPKTDLFGYLTTKELSKGWYLLSNEYVTVLVDTVKTRIYRIFTHGSFGTLQQLVYDTDGYEQSKGNWGIVPYFWVGNEKFYPFYHNYDFRKHDFPARQIDFFPNERRLVLKGINYASEGFAEKALVTGGEMEICLDGKILNVKVKYPDTAHRTGIHTCWYPLYDMIKTEDRMSYIEYQYGLSILGPKEIELRDTKGRMPGIKISSKKQVLQFKAEKDMSRGEAFKLHVDFEGWTVYDELTFEFRNNPVAICVNPIVDAGESIDIKVYSEEEPEFAIDGDRIIVNRLEKGIFSCKTLLNKGKHVLKAKVASGISEREIWAVSDWEHEIVRVAGAVRNAQWKDDPIKGLFPHAINVRDGTPCRDGQKIGNEKAKEFSVSYYDYSSRQVHVLAAASVLTGDKSYLDSAKLGIETIRKLSHLREDGGRVAPVEILGDGAISKEMVHSLRPATFGNIISALLSCVKGYRHLHDNVNASECLEWACEYAKSLFPMQADNGCFFETYTYPDLRVYCDNIYGATVCAWLIRIWELAMEIENSDALMCSNLKEMCRKAVDFLLTIEPSLLRVSGAEGGHTNSMESLFPASALCLIKFLTGGEEKYREYAQDMYAKGVLSTCLYIDQPQSFMFPCNWWHSIYFTEKGNYPDGLIGKGGMFDLTVAECSIAMIKYAGFKLAEDVMKYVFGTRLTTSIFDNGVLCVYEVSIPNFYYKNEIISEDCEYGGLGLAGLYYGLEIGATDNILPETPLANLRILADEARRKSI